MAVMALRKIIATEGGTVLEITANLAAVASSDKFQNVRGKSLIYVQNGGGSSDNVTIDGNPDIVVAVPAGEHRVIGTFNEDFEDSSGFVLVSHSFITSVNGMAAHLAED